MVRGLGLDLLETARVERLLASHGERFERRVFTELERRQCRGRADRAQALAARFAAKEACAKALGTGIAQGVGWKEIEIVRAEDGRPRLQLHGEAAALARRAGIDRTHLSLTHQPGMVAAVVILEGSGR
jgi:holo-[acyl-carrier protein] synthase